MANQPQRKNSHSNHIFMSLFNGQPSLLCCSQISVPTIYIEYMSKSRIKTRRKRDRNSIDVAVNTSKPCSLFFSLTMCLF